MSCNFGEIIIKLHFLASRKPTRGLPTPSPPPLREPLPHIFHVLDGKCGSRVRESLAGGGGGRAGWSAKWCHSITEHQIDCKFKTKVANSILLLCFFCQDLSNSYWWLMASFGEFIQWREAIKGSQSLRLALSRLHYIQQATSLWTKEVGHSNTRGTVRLCSFPLKLLLHIVCIFNILCGLEVINSRRLK